jgi:hypothetical protein
MPVGDWEAAVQASENATHHALDYVLVEDLQSRQPFVNPLPASYDDCP